MPATERVEAHPTTKRILARVNSGRLAGLGLGVLLCCLHHTRVGTGQPHQGCVAVVCVHIPLTLAPAVDLFLPTNTRLTSVRPALLDSLECS